jgi:hypothetical protein
MYIIKYKDVVFPLSPFSPVSPLSPLFQRVPIYIPFTREYFEKSGESGETGETGEISIEGL